MQGIVTWYYRWEGDSVRGRREERGGEGGEILTLVTKRA